MWLKEKKKFFFDFEKFIDWKVLSKDLIDSMFDNNTKPDNYEFIQIEDIKILNIKLDEHVDYNIIYLKHKILIVILRSQRDIEELKKYCIVINIQNFLKINLGDIDENYIPNIEENDNLIEFHIYNNDDITFEPFEIQVSNNKKIEDLKVIIKEYDEDLENFELYIQDNKEEILKNDDLIKDIFKKSLNIFWIKLIIFR